MFHYKKTAQDKLAENCKKIETQCKKLRSLMRSDEEEEVIPEIIIPKKKEEGIVYEQRFIADWRQ